MEAKYLKHFTKASLLSLSLLFCVGCTSEPKASYTLEPQDISIIKTTQNHDDVVKDKNGNQFTIKMKDGWLSYSVKNYKTSAFDAMPKENEISGSYSPNSDNKKFDLLVQSSKAPDTEGNLTAHYYFTYNMDDSGKLVLQKEGLEDFVSDNLAQEQIDYFETDKVQSLSAELIDTLNSYIQLKDTK